MNSRLVIKSWGTELPEDVWTHQCADGGEAPHSSNKKCKRNSANVQQQEKLTSAPLKSSAPLSQLINTQHFLGEIADRESVCPGQQPTSSHLKCLDSQSLTPVSQAGTSTWHQPDGSGIRIEYGTCVHTIPTCMHTHSLQTWKNNNKWKNYTIPVNFNRILSTQTYVLPIKLPFF